MMLMTNVVNLIETLKSLARCICKGFSRSCIKDLGYIRVPLTAAAELKRCSSTYVVTPTLKNIKIEFTFERNFLHFKVKRPRLLWLGNSRSPMGPWSSRCIPNVSRCLPNYSQMLPRCGPDVFQMPPRCGPDVFQMSPKGIFPQ